MCKAKGALDYQRSMYCYELMLRYWEKKKLPIIELLRLNHTMFSEESGEIALSALTTSQPLSTRADIEQTRQHWQIVKLKYEPSCRSAVASSEKISFSKYVLSLK